MALFVTATLSSVAAATSSTQVLAANQGVRHGCLIFNDSSAAMYLAYAATASTSSYSVLIPANSYWEMPTGEGGAYGGVLSAVWSSATGNARVTELTQ